VLFAALPGIHCPRSGGLFESGCRSEPENLAQPSKRPPGHMQVKAGGGRLGGLPYIPRLELECHVSTTIIKLSFLILIKNCLT